MALQGDLEMPTLLELTKEHAAAEDRRDVAATIATFTHDCVYTVEAFGIDLRGRDQAAQHYAGAFSAWPDFYNKEVILFDAGDDIFAKAYVEFTHTVEWNGIPPNGKKIGFWSVAHFPKAEDGLLKGEHVYLNGNEFLHKLGALPSANALEVAAHIRTLEARIAELERALAAK
jgi:steroid delta-isomerase-like uncharacterized protein